MARRRRSRRALIVVASAVGVSLLLAGALAWSAVRDEEARWRDAHRLDTEQSWTRYADWARELRTSFGVSAFVVERFTDVRPRALLASERALVLHTNALIAREEWPTVCAILREHAATPAATRAREALGERIERGLTTYRTTAEQRGTPPEIALAVTSALHSLREGDPCREGALIRVEHHVDANGAFASEAEDGHTVADLLRAIPLEERARETGEALARDLTAATGGVLGARYAPPDDPATTTTSIRVLASFVPRDRFATSSGRELPGVSLTVRVTVDGAGPGSTQRDSTYTLPATFAIDLYRAGESDGGASIADVYARMVGELHPNIGTRARQVIGIDAYAAPALAGMACTDVAPLPANRRLRGSTRDGVDRHTGSCAPDDGYGDDYEYDDESYYPEQVYRLVVPTRSDVAVVAEGDLDALVYLRSECGYGAAGDIACDADDAQLEATLDAGVYYVFVDSQYSDEEGSPFEVYAAVRDSAEVASACASAPSLAVGAVVSGSTSGGRDRIEGTCGGIGTAERLYRLAVPQRSRLRCTTSTDFVGVLSARSDCDDRESEVACVRTSTAARAELVALVERGNHTIAVDGGLLGEAGSFTLQCELAPPDGVEGTEADGCAAPGVVTGSGELAVDTFAARDDLRGSCGGAGAPDRVYRIDVSAPTHLRAQWIGAGPGVLYVTRGCEGGELACATTQPLSAELAPGTYYLVADGTSAAAFGVGRVSIQLDDLETVCRDAPVLSPGQRTSGDTTNAAPRFQGTCAGAPTANELVYRLDVDRPSRVILRASAPVLDAALYLRRECTRASAEVACTTRDASARVATLDTVLDAGRYFVFVDGHYGASRGAFELAAEVTPVDQ